MTKFLVCWPQRTSITLSKHTKQERNERKTVKFLFLLCHWLIHLILHFFVLSLVSHLICLRNFNFFHPSQYGTVHLFQLFPFEMLRLWSILTYCNWLHYCSSISHLVWNVPNQFDFCFVLFCLIQFILSQTETKHMK